MTKETGFGTLKATRGSPATSARPEAGNPGDHKKKGEKTMILKKPVPPDCVKTLGFGPYSEDLQKLTGRKNHNGIDFALPHNIKDRLLPIFAAADGLIWQAGYDKERGNYVLLLHTTEQNIIITEYFHMKQCATTPGKIIKAGEIIGYMGSTGMSTAKHLHFGMKILTPYLQEMLDPANYFKA